MVLAISILGDNMVAGIYGGMGPVSHIEFEKLLIEECKRRGSKRDQDYPDWVVVSGASTPDRVKSLQGGHETYKHMVANCQKLEKAGVDFIVIVCNTAHAYIARLQEEIKTPIVSMIECAVEQTLADYPQAKVIGVMGNTTILSSKLYQEQFPSKIKIVHPKINFDIQKMVMEAIYDSKYGIKATGSKLSRQARVNLKVAEKWYIDQKVEAIIMACTELSVAFGKIKSLVPIIDPLKCLAEKTIDLCWPA